MTMGLRSRTVRALVAIVCGVGCDAEPDTTYVRIDYFRQPCGTDGAAFCYRVLEHDAAGALALERIEGLAYEWGHVYELLVEDIGRRPTLVEQLDKSPVLEPRFVLELGSPHVDRVDTERLRLSDAVTADCDDTSVCTRVAEALMRDARFTIELDHDRRSRRFTARDAWSSP